MEGGKKESKPSKGEMGIAMKRKICFAMTANPEQNTCQVRET
jgi:hypothetical protein